MATKRSRLNLAVLGFTRSVPMSSIQLEVSSLPVVFLNSALLVASTFVAILASAVSRISFLGALFLVGAVFLTSQLGEVSLANSFFGPASYAVILLAMQIHGSHVILGLLLFGIILGRGTFEDSGDSLIVLGLAYWHLIEVV